MKTPDEIDAVIAGRFQVPELSEAQVSSIESIIHRHHRIALFLLDSPLKASSENPLDISSRSQMLNTIFPDLPVFVIQDMAVPEKWSEKVDQLAEAASMPSAVLYGGEEFTLRYSGSHRVVEMRAFNEGEESNMRRMVFAEGAKNSRVWREGAVWSSHYRYPTVYTTVDVAVFDASGVSVLLGRKEHEELWRLPGGFAEPDSESFECDARREVHEETGLEITDPVYIGSFKSGDWRYEHEQDKIKTLLFTAKAVSADAVAADDLAEVRWLELDEITESMIVETHRPLIRKVKQVHGSLPD